MDSFPQKATTLLSAFSDEQKRMMVRACIDGEMEAINQTSGRGFSKQGPGTIAYYNDMANLVDYLRNHGCTATEFKNQQRIVNSDSTVQLLFCHGHLVGREIGTSGRFLNGAFAVNEKGSFTTSTINETQIPLPGFEDRSLPSASLPALLLVADIRTGKQKDAGDDAPNEDSIEIYLAVTTGIDESGRTIRFSVCETLHRGVLLADNSQVTLVPAFDAAEEVIVTKKI